MQGYTTEKMEYMSLFAVVAVRHSVPSYLLQETHLPASTMLIGTPVNCLVL